MGKTGWFKLTLQQKELNHGQCIFKANFMVAGLLNEHTHTQNKNDIFLHIFTNLIFETSSDSINIDTQLNPFQVELSFK